MFKLASAVAAALFLVNLSAWAWPPTYGAEFELSHPDFKNEPLNNSRNAIAGNLKLQFVENLRKLCETKGCTVTEAKGKWENGFPSLDMHAAPFTTEMGKDYLVTMADGWWFKVSHDPGCVEITTKPSTLAELRQQKEIMNEMIFKSGKSLGFRIPPMESAHFNIGAKSAFANGENLMRFFVDYHNHPELAFGALGSDFNNAPSLALLKPEQREKVAELVEIFKSGESFEIPELGQWITRNIYTQSYNPEWGGAHHYQAIGLKYVNPYEMSKGDRPMEMRAVWNQKDAEHFIKLAELFEARINYLNKSRYQVIYRKTTQTEFNTEEMATRFYLYVTETGLSFDRYKVLLPHFLRNTALAVFLDEKASMKERLESIKHYQEILPDSEGLRIIAKQLIAKARRQTTNPDYQLLQQALEVAKSQSPIACKKLHPSAGF